MTSGIAANYSLPNLSNTLTTNAVANASSSSTAMDASNIGSTFLNLLTQELQNQDPTSPMDSSAMVGQMISLNSLSQLIGINQTLSSVSGASASSPAASAQPQSATSPVKDAAAAAIQAAASSSNPLSYMWPMNQLAGANPAYVSNNASAQSALLSSPSAVR